MNKNKFFTKIDQSDSLRLSLNYSCSLLSYQSEIYNTNDPILKLLYKLEDIYQIIYGNKITKISKYIYFNKTFIQKILYEKDEVLNIKYNKYNNNLEFFFYLVLLIRENPDIYNYNFELEYIEQLNKENNTSTEKKINQIIKAKLIIELSNEYILDNDLDDESEEGKELNRIIEDNTIIIENNISIFEEIDNKLNKNNIIDISIDELYFQIIIGLIESNKFGNFNYVYDIIRQLNLDEIDINKFMYDNIKQYIDDEKNIKILNNYIIKEEKDLKDENNENKINFNFILIKYILKNIYNICDIKYISNLRESLKKIFNNNKNKDSLKDIEKNKYLRIKEILDLLFVQPKKHVKNNLKTYYNKFQSNIFKHKKKLKPDGENKNDKKDDHGQLFLVDCIYQIFEVQEFRDEYNNIVNKDKYNKKDENKKDKKDEDDYNLLMNYLANSNKDEKRLIEILKKEQLKNVLQNPDKKLNEKNLKNLFSFVSLNDDEILNKIENDFALLDKGNELNFKDDKAINEFNKYFKDIPGGENNNSNGNDD